MFKLFRWSDEKGRYVVTTHSTFNTALYYFLRRPKCDYIVNSEGIILLSR